MDLPSSACMICKIKPRVNPLTATPRTVAKYGLNKVTIRIQVPNYVSFPDEVRRASKLLPKFKAVRFVYDWDEVPSGVRAAVQKMTPVWEGLECILASRTIEGEPAEGMHEVEDFFASDRAPEPNVPIPKAPKPDVPIPKAPKPDVPNPKAPKPDAPKLSSKEAEDYAMQIIKQARTYGGAPSLTIPVSGQISVKAINYIRNQNLHHLSDSQIVQIMQAITQIAARGK